MSDNFNLSSHQISWLGTSPPVQWAASTLGLKTIPVHINSILIFTTLFTILYTHIAEHITKLIIHKQWTTFTDKERNDWKLRVVSLAHSSIVGPASLYVVVSQCFFWEPTTMIERLYGYFELDTRITDIALGYFLFHFAMMALEYKKHGLSMIVHSVVGVTFLSGVYQPFACSMCTWLLIFELTNVPHNIYHFLTRLGMGLSKASIANAVIWIIFFFIFRLLWGTYAAVAALWDTYQAMITPRTEAALGAEEYASLERLRAQGLEPIVIGKFMMAWCTARCFALIGLNFWWFYVIVTTMIRKLKAKNASKDK